MSTFTSQQKNLSSLIGGALGDALGYSREFSPVPAHLKSIPGRDWRNADFDNAPNAAYYQDETGHALVSDDTQMTIATGRALIAAETGPHLSYVDSLATELARKYVYWSKHPDNTRAPGNACMTACRKLDDDRSWESDTSAWQQATDINTMGCGANMRVAPIGLYMNPIADLIDLAYLSSAMTHAHPAALASAALTTAAVTGAYDGMNGREILDLLIEICRAPGPYPKTVLGDLWKQSEYSSSTAYLRVGYELCKGYLLSARAALNLGWAGHCDPCEITGDGWTAPEALAGAMLCTVGLWDKPVQVLQRAAVSRGDSDSLASIAGNIRGAAGVEWPEHLVSRLEQAPVRELHTIAKAL
jgi:ADP-ribosylglycohydrolase